MTETAVQQATRRAAEVLAAMTPEEVARAEALPAFMLQRFACMFAGEEMPEKKGKQPVMHLSVEEMRKFRETEPATHRWAAWEREILG